MTLIVQKHLEELFQLLVTSGRFPFFNACCFFNCYLVAPRSALVHYRGDSLTHLMLITVFYIFKPKVTGNLVTRLAL